MEEVRRKRATALGVRSRFPAVSRVLALAVIGTGVIFIGVSYYKLRHTEPFVMRPGSPELSSEVTAIFNNYEQRVMKGDRLYLLLKASRDITYSDGHHELEDVHLEVHPAEGDKPDQINARKSIYDQKSGLVSFAGDVQIEMHDGLSAKTESLLYNQKTEVADTSDPITFSRENVSGSSTGATIDSKNKHLELRNAVDITVDPNLKHLNADREDGRGAPIEIKAPHGMYDQGEAFLSFTGGATAEQAQDLMSGDTLSAVMSQQKKVQRIEARGNSYLRSTTDGHAAEVHSGDMDFFLDGGQQLHGATARRDVTAQTLNSDAQMQLTGASSLEVKFQSIGGRNILSEMRGEGRSVINLSAPQSQIANPKAANKRLTADAVKLVWRQTGRDLERAEAVGNAELFVDPVQKTVTADRKTITAPRFDCEFFETGNLARLIVATGGSKAVIAPVQPTDQRGTRVLTSQKMSAMFVKESQDLDHLDAQGDAKFNEMDRNGAADNMSYIAANEVIHLRGGEPTVWDSRARVKGQEIDSDTRKQVSYARGKSSTTYYSQEQTNGATPFSKVKSPVYVVSDRAEFQHATGIAIYSGNARAWQDDNFVRGDTLTIFRDDKRMEANGRIQSLLYQTRRKNSNGSSEVVPVFATADRMYYSDTDRLVHYDGHVDIKQGTDRMTSEVADVYLLKDTNEVERTVAQRQVVLTQPGKHGTAERGQFTAADETVVLTGSPARVDDVEQGSTESGRLTVYLRENRVVADQAQGAHSTGRVRSIHKVRKP